MKTNEDYIQHIIDIVKLKEECKKLRRKIKRTIIITERVQLYKNSPLKYKKNGKNNRIQRHNRRRLQKCNGYVQRKNV